jgi:uncharacterized repeat protein (TIGR01451 family)
MPTILQQLCEELKYELSFYRKGEIENVSRPGQPHRVGDKIKFTVAVKNSHKITMKNISGWITAAPAVTFNSVSFSVPQLNPNKKKTLAVITASVVADTNDSVWFFDKVANITASAEADLSTIRFSDTGLVVDVILPA